MAKQKTASFEAGKFNTVNFSYYFIVSLLSMFAVFIVFVVPFFPGLTTTRTIPVNIVTKESDADRQELAFSSEEREPEIMLQIGGEDLPANFFKPLSFGQTIKDEITADDFVSPLNSSIKVDGWWFTLPELESYKDIEVYFRSCPDDGDQDNYNNCLAFSAFTESLWLFDSDMNQLYAGNTRVDFDSIPITADKTYYLIVGSNGKPGHYKITLDYEKQAVEFKVKFAGINNNKGEIKVNVGLYRPWTSQKLFEIGEVVLTGNDQGVYKGSFLLDNVSFDFSGNTLLIKGPKHLQRRFSDLSFEKGKVLDLTSKVLEPGDLPLPQDGKVNSSDFNYLWEHRGSTDAAVLAIGDLNLDGACNMGDVNLFLETLQTKNDEEGF